MSNAPREPLTPAMVAILLRRRHYLGLSNWWPVRHDGQVIGYAAGFANAFVAAVEAEKAAKGAMR